ncbi:hypothetical protein FVEG_13412 [Fusarium verticillioides 7600]|uniref:Uncharacterized protein n=1 Tax=Gibberella moniliformis (strain M3125 / FGSC 7600) TaxID=334819 RepID=W7N5R4_GIBM7|nr:hypothetical protein FVEG_13412 [Fusarium verticillioides 7600]EWG55405.1 hypothetical protein FVEG_13412 [Fusarium verticillioides 7600]
MPKNRPSKEKRDQAKTEERRVRRIEKETKENDRVKAIAGDDTLDFAAKIDCLAEIRNWFCADTTIVDQYMSDELSTASAVDILAKPIDEAYSTANAGTEYFRQERVARIQRKYHSPENALQLWGHEQDWPEPDNERDHSENAEMLLWNLWYAILHTAKKIHFSDEARQRKVVDLVRAFKARPNPPEPVPMTIPLKRNWVWELGTVWSDLIILGASIAEMRNDSCGCGAGWTWPEQQAEQNLNAFYARLTASGVANIHVQGEICAVDALERVPTPWYRRVSPPPDHEILSHYVTCAALWTIIAGKAVYARYPHTRDERDIEVVDRILELKGNELPWNRSRKKYKGRARWETARREFARRRFEAECQNKELSLDVRELAGRAAKAMDGIVWQT